MGTRSVVYKLLSRKSINPRWFVDELTSRLDAFIALTIVQSLKEYTGNNSDLELNQSVHRSSSRGATVICSIHQRRSNFLNSIRSRIVSIFYQLVAKQYLCRPRASVFDHFSFCRLSIALYRFQSCRVFRWSLSIDTRSEEWKITPW